MTSLLGNYSPSSASDYILGSNHILPTNCDTINSLDDSVDRLKKK